jgi:2-polyprenyl-3-methyl-5-hydroxy-6-metoxy-1,4-benzoquinol methylase
MQREDWDKRYSTVENLWAVKPNRFLVAEVAELEPGRALDLACGEGQNAIWLATLGWDVTGVDFSEVAIAKARARAERDGVRVEFACADLLEYEPAGAFDLVLVLYLHIAPSGRRQVLANAAAALAPGGTFVLVGHDLTNLTDGVGGPSDPSLLCTPDEIAGELPGLEIVKAERVLRDVGGEQRDAIDALVRAQRPVPS